MLNGEWEMNSQADRSAHSLRIPHSPLPIRHSRPGLTLIELLVTIVIMVTVLAGALPLLSPNNNSRKLREASRQLNSLLAQAQAQAARDGRPVGVAFRESGASAPYSGMALEAYLIAEPQPFAGFSEHSRVAVGNTGMVYGLNAVDGKPPNEGERFSPKLDGLPVCKLDFYASGGVDAFPPRTLKIGDTIAVGGNLFLICDDADQTTMPNRVEEVGDVAIVEYLFSDPAAAAQDPGTTLNGVWLNFHGQQLPQVPAPPAVPPGQAYAIRRQPMNTSDQPLQFPRGIGIDLLASGADGLNVPSQFDEIIPVAPVPSGSPPPLPLTVGVMFSPNGSLDMLYLDGVRKDGVEQVYFLMGLFENGNSDAQDPADYDFTAGTSIADDELAQRRTRINWLNPDSRWVSVNRAGRIITAENNVSFDPRVVAYSDLISGTPQQQNRERVMRQLNGADSDGDGIIDLPGARLYAKQMSGSTGR
jgi:prepilin-type N-terminal cleavage/methylation domain-containing protein